MKKINIILIIFTLIGSVILTLGFARGGTFNDVKNIFNNDYKYTKMDNILIDDNIKSLDINADNRYIEIIESTTSSYIEYYLNQKDETFENSVISDTLNFKIDHTFNLLNSINMGYTSRNVSTVYIYLNKENVDVINIYNKSGNIKIDHSMNINELTLESVSGNISLHNLNVNSITNIKITSGNLLLNNINSDEINVNLTSGNLKGTGTIKSNIFKTSTKSGNITIDSLEANKSSIKIVSGNLRIKNNLSLDNLIESKSGNISITDKREHVLIGFNISLKSGSLKIFGKKYLEKTDNLDLYNIKYKINSASGNINIY